MINEIKTEICLCLPVDSLMPVQTLREWNELKALNNYQGETDMAIRASTNSSTFEGKFPVSKDTLRLSIYHDFASNDETPVGINIPALGTLCLEDLAYLTRSIEECTAHIGKKAGIVQEEKIKISVQGNQFNVEDGIDVKTALRFPNFIVEED